MFFELTWAWNDPLPMADLLVIEGVNLLSGEHYSESMIFWLVVSNIFYFHPYLGKIPILTNIFQRGWNHQPVLHFAATWIIPQMNLIWQLPSLPSKFGVRLGWKPGGPRSSVKVQPAAESLHHSCSIRKVEDDALDEWIKTPPQKNKLHVEISFFSASFWPQVFFWCDFLKKTLPISHVFFLIGVWMFPERT